MERSPRTGAANSLGGLVPRKRVRVSLQGRESKGRRLGWSDRTTTTRLPRLEAASTQW